MENAGDTADVLLRLVTGLAVVPHGWQKLRSLVSRDSAPQLTAFERSDCRSARFWIAMVGALQCITGALIAIGLVVVPAASLQVLMMMAIIVRWPGERAWFQHRDRIEYPVILAIISLCVLLQAVAQQG